MKNEFLPQELNVGEWTLRAQDDKLNAESILRHRDGTPSAPCFLSQQMSEKYLKAFLIHKKKWFPKIHFLDRIVELCMEIDDSFKEVKDDAIFLDTFYVSARYPADYPEFNWQNAEEAVEAALRIEDFVLSKIEKGENGKI